MVFVTGASGLIGSFIIRELIQTGHTVRAIRRARTDMSLLADVEDRVEWKEGDVLDVSLMEEYSQGAEVIIHGAAVVSFMPRDIKTMYQVNVEGTRNMLYAAQKNRVKKFCFLSSIAALGRSDHQKTIDETSKWEESSLNSHYAQSKHQAEMEVWRAEAEGLATIILNPSVVIGPGDWQRSSTQLFRHVWKNNPFYPPGGISYVDVRDVAEAVVKASFSDIHGERFILNGGHVPYKEFLGHASKLMARRKPSYPLYPFLAEILWRIFKVYSWLSGQTPILTRETAKLSRLSFRYSSEKVQKMLHQKFRPLGETLQWTCTILREKYQF